MLVIDKFKRCSVQDILKLIPKDPENRLSIEKTLNLLQNQEETKEENEELPQKEEEPTKIVKKLNE